MGYNGETSNTMKPEMNDTTVHLPITFDYNGGSKEAKKSKYVWAGVSLVVGVIFSFGVIFSKNGFIALNILLGLVILYGTIIFVRFTILKEDKFRNDLVNLVDLDYKKTYADIWGISTISEEYPYYGHLRNGKIISFVQFEKDVILGKYSSTEYSHYEAIGDAYNLAGSQKIGMCHIDYMDNIGSDDRLAQCFSNLVDVENPELQEILAEVYTNLQEMMEDRYSEFDVYAFTAPRGVSEKAFEHSLNQIISCFLSANYVRFGYLNSDRIRDLVKSVYNLHDFSVVDASLDIFDNTRRVGVIPISFTDEEGNIEKINKTVSEKKEEAILIEKEKSLRKEEAKRRRKAGKKTGKGKKKSTLSGGEEDLFDILDDEEER